MELTERQRELHRTHIGGSSAGILTGESDRASPRHLYAYMTGELDEPPIDAEACWLGHAMEEPILFRLAAHVERELGHSIKFTMPRTTRRSRAYPWAIAHADALLSGEPAGMEAKVRVSDAGFGPTGSDELPGDIYAQCVHYLELYDRAVWWVGVYFPFRFECRFYRIDRDRDVAESVMDTEAQFMELVERREPPDFDWQHRATPDLVRRLYRGTNGQQLVFEDEAEAELLASYVDVWQDAREKRMDLERLEKLTKARIQVVMDQYPFTILPDGRTLYRKLVNPGSGRPAYFQLRLK